MSTGTPAGEGKRFSLRVRLLRRWVAVLLLGGIAAGAMTYTPAKAQSDQPSRDDIEAAYLYNFGKFVRWPAGMQGPLTICVAGRDSFEQTVARLIAGEHLNGRDLAARAVDRAEGVRGCSILFVGTADRLRVDSYLAAARGKPMLTVGETPDFLARGGVVQFVLSGDHVRFSVNLNAASRNRLGLSSELLKVAVSVTGGPAKGGAR